MPDLDEIQRVAGSKTYNRGVGYKSNVKQLSFSSEMGGVFVTCFCKANNNSVLSCYIGLYVGEGNSPEPYAVSASVNRHGLLTDYCCTCPMGEKSDCCKHIVAMLLVFKTTQEAKASSSKSSACVNAFIPSPAADKASNTTDPSNVSPVETDCRTVSVTCQQVTLVKEQTHSEAFTLDLARSLPPWISKNSGPSDGKQKAEEKNEYRYRPPIKRQKSCNVMYQMSEEELVQTAKEILEKAGQDPDKLKMMTSLSDQHHSTICKMDVFDTDELQLSVFEEQVEPKILAEASPSMPFAELEMKHYKASSSLRTVRTSVAETLVPDTVGDITKNEKQPISSMPFIPETVGDDQRKNDRYSCVSGSESEDMVDVDEFLWGN
jgi:hypothetical protein